MEEPGGLLFGDLAEKPPRREKRKTARLPDSY
jgi:hypothetical protein